jgi:hypothetical protein
MMTGHAELRFPGSWSALTRRWSSWLGRVWPLRGARDGGSIVIMVEHGGASVPVVVEDDLPDEAYDALLAVDPANAGPGPLRFDRFHGKWRAIEMRAS